MRKEVLFAIIFGIILGGVILYGMNLANKSVTSLKEEIVQNSPATPTPTPTNNLLFIVSPQNHSVTSDKTITLTGRATPAANLAVVSETDDLILKASPEGTFSAQINLIGGENTIAVTELKSDNTTITEAITIIQTINLPE
ncbi:hypothetical protein A3K29_04575 [Candidatus Collierbacteria bacterium RIFOXYB2_FULL_46_14]|uniref:Polymorphic outer membrane protein n=1 Tax=Candidatus Collierbacteria bacterium GW2011_GWA2_46_26 TaxID=1618381 RepID=A0A0G1PKE7_9BACT|nr:MAG: hypothetical protein UW29_C0005G0019 [Candidatus Collierbacteria bacterium GW2011_GWC2_44_13]KKU33147.1 MAG: hypothetical protein UX47_C0006G0118 [Candidatus Collierbacteria bacterium GW2011_GWA2_46_26]OGD73373.1 MAG: hypothetical protein A3K29_04575 [Candidatus Collierbacteria bacterium RIFOXYB2_FULL_46_14]OGD76415.1 MAG: hypothetical protein A3K43_04575 [Candidatus Collierbacteria bacterium RIFOXYA2_FULL_46_20]OGD77751.1 MAG: hypothetical protein A3K39_04575 [Candidatus Collierbacteri